MSAKIGDDKAPKAPDRIGPTPTVRNIRPKYLLWITFGVIFSTWYALDLAAHPVGSPLSAILRIDFQKGFHPEGQEASFDAVLM